MSIVAPCPSVSSGVSLGNPLHIHGGNVKFAFNIGAAVEKTMFQSVSGYVELLAFWGCYTSRHLVENHWRAG